MQKNDKKLTILFSIILVSVALVGLVTAFLLNYNTLAPELPIVLDDGNSIYISTSHNDNYVGYRFKFVDDRGNEVFVDCENNIVDANYAVDKGIVVGKNYKVSVCYLSKNEKNNSRFSQEIDWKCQVYLGSSVISFDNSQSIVYWNAVENADFYRIYYNDSNGVGVLETQETQIDLTSFAGGEKVMYVVACSNNVNYKDGQKSNVLEFEYIHYYSRFTNLSFDKSNKILRAENKELIEKIDVYLNSEKFSIIKFNVELVGQIYVYHIDLSLIFSQETEIGICPGNIDKYNIFEEEITVINLN